MPYEADKSENTNSEEQREEPLFIKTTTNGAKLLDRLMKAGDTASKRINVSSDNFEVIEVEEEIRKEKGRRHLIGLRWYGGKYSHLGWLLPLLPKAIHYCEPFGGSAAVLINRESSPLETFNDIDGDLVNFFRVLRDKPDELIEKLYLTPFSREEFRNAIALRGRTDVPDIERARLFFIRAEQVRIGLAQTATQGRWAWCKLTSRRGMAGAVSRWMNRIEALWAVAQRLKSVQIENLDALEVIEKYDSKDTLFYCDPPYPHESRGDSHAYGFEMSEEQHLKLAEVFHNVKGIIALSSYRSPLMDRLYKDEKWIRVDAPKKIAHSVKQLRQESLWINYNPMILGEDIINKVREIGCEFNPPIRSSLLYYSK